jgi:hypothetical protein
MNVVAVISTINTLLIVFFFNLGLKLVRKKPRLEPATEAMEENDSQNNVYHTTGVFAFLYGGIIMVVTIAILFIDYLKTN